MKQALVIVAVAAFALASLAAPAAADPPDPRSALPAGHPLAIDPHHPQPDTRLHRVRGEVSDPLHLADSEPALPTHTERYGWSVIMVDAAALGMGIGSTRANAAAMSSAALALFVLGGPAVHIMHDNGGGAIVSLALRVSIPMAGAFVGPALSGCGDDGWCQLGGMVMGLAAGAATASILDATLVARTEVIDENTEPWLVHAGSLHANPVVAATDSGSATLGLAGTF
ncbi:MAG TPA: hypothetical protein VFG83_03830 [Kofleriaceae bacterium]|nr:hypothetical protein [Kofleriaceae bacterium]